MVARRSRSEQKPLAGCRILVTRARKQAASLSGALRDLGATVVEIPSIEIRPPRSNQPLDDAIGRLDGYDWLILTSVNGVEALFARMAKLGHDASALAHLNICAIGPATRRAIEQHGARVKIVPQKYVAESVVRALESRVKGRRVLLVRAKVARDVIPADLRRAGAEVDVVEAYETVVPSSSRARLQALLRDARRRTDAITFTSSSTARNFLELLGSGAAHKLDGIVLASIGPVTTGTLREIGLRADVEAREFTMSGLVAALVAALQPR